MPYTIKQVSEMTKIPATALRYYDKEGLLPFLGRSESGYRLFSDGDISMLQVLECLKSTGMSIREMKQFAAWVSAGDDSLQQRYEMFLKRKAAVEGQIAELNKMLEIINHKCRYYEAAIKEGTEENLKKNDKLPYSEAFACKKY